MRCPKLLLALVCLALITCVAARAQSLSEPERNFEALWKTFDEKYSHFGVKNVDWQAIYRIYRPKVTASTTDDELFDILGAMIAHLNDNHVGLRTPSRRFRAGILQELHMEDFSLDLVKEKYLKGKALPLHDGVFHYGWLTDTIGYFHFRGFGNVDASGAAVDAILKEFRNARALVVDVRGNGGGDDRVGRAIASRFADRQRLYMTVALRNGPTNQYQS